MGTLANMSYGFRRQLLPETIVIIVPRSNMGVVGAFYVPGPPGPGGASVFSVLKLDPAPAKPTRANKSNVSFICGKTADWNY